MFEGKKRDLNAASIQSEDSARELPVARLNSMAYGNATNPDSTPLQTNAVRFVFQPLFLLYL